MDESIHRHDTSHFLYNVSKNIYGIRSFRTWTAKCIDDQNMNDIMTFHFFGGARAEMGFV